MEKKTILLVEDEYLISALCKEIVASFGYEVVTANTGEKAVEIALSQENIDLILMDINLGSGIDGTQAARCILEKKKLPIVFLTSHSEKEYVDRVKQITRYGYVIKNSTDFVLQSSIEMAFELFEAHRSIELRMEALRSSEERFRGFIENARDIVYEMTKEGIFTYLSPNWHELMGEDASLAIGKSFMHYVHPNDINLYRDFLEQIHNTGNRLINVDYRVLHKDSSVRWHAARGSILRRKSGDMAGYMGIARDITERKLVEEALSVKMDELQRFHNLTVDRELKMIELKKEVNALLKASGQNEKYRIIN